MIVPSRYAGSIVSAYFDAKWWDSGITAAAAFDAAKLSAIRGFAEKIAAIEALSLETFLRDHCHASMAADSVWVKANADALTSDEPLVKERAD